MKSVNTRNQVIQLFFFFFLALEIKTWSLIECELDQRLEKVGIHSFPT